MQRGLTGLINGGLQAPEFGQTKAKGRNYILSASEVHLTDFDEEEKKPETQQHKNSLQSYNLDDNLNFQNIEN